MKFQQASLSQFNLSSLHSVYTRRFQTARLHFDVLLEAALLLVFIFLQSLIYIFLIAFNRNTFVTEHVNIAIWAQTHTRLSQITSESLLLFFSFFFFNPRRKKNRRRALTTCCRPNILELGQPDSAREEQKDGWVDGWMDERSDGGVDG